VRHTAKGFWLDEVGPVDQVRPAADGSLSADVVIVGGGYLGMWTAWYLTEAEPNARVAILEADVCGEGPSGRNGGIANPLWDELPTLVERYGAARAIAVAEASEASVGAIGAWSREHSVDCWFRPGPVLEVSTGPSQDGRWREGTDRAAELGFGDRYRELDHAEVMRLCPSPRFRSGALLSPAATVNPGRLARGLRARLLERGVEIFERSPATALDRTPSGCVARTPRATVRAARAVLAVNARLAGWPGFARRLSVASSHMVVTEPVPDVLEALRWVDGPAVVDHQTMLHYLRPTADGRIAIGWGGGRMGYGGRIRRGLEVDPYAANDAIRTLRRIFPRLAGRGFTHAWGGPIDISPIHLPIFGSDGPVGFGYGFTGNGVAPSNLGGRILADIALDRRTDATRLALVDPPDVPMFPPEPLRFVGGSLIRRALIRRDGAEDAGRRTDPLTRFVAGLPQRLGMHLPR
jgi:glycine/D-amino acid oxidase-like deaminating enzyme